MNAIRYLYAAYAATWIIHITYLGIIFRRYRRVRRKAAELGKTGET